MAATFFTADLHFGHERILELSGRPFATIAEHDEALIDRWNSVVRQPDDIVWVLGDYALGDRSRALGYLPRLNGRKLLVVGNHDRCYAGSSSGWKATREYLDAGFEIVTHASSVKLPSTGRGVAGRRVLLSHFPYNADHTDSPRHQQWRLRDEGEWLVHGHVHEAYTVRERGVNVGVDRWNYQPVPATTIAQIIDDVEAGRRYTD